MILAEPPPSQGDLHFRLFGFPVRIHPFFWVIAVLFSLRGDSPPEKVLSWVVALFVSILIHELGHAFLQRRYGGHPRIVLHGMGGLAICSDCQRSTRSQILISLAGPIAGFIFAAVLFVMVNLSGYQAGISLGPPNITGFSVELLGMNFYWEALPSMIVNEMIGNLLQINVMWGAVNLLPIYPLDGGHISRELCQLRSPSQGIVLSLQISMIAAIGMAVVGFSWGELYIVILFGYLAYSSYQALEAYRASRW